MTLVVCELCIYPCQHKVTVYHMTMNDVYPTMQYEHMHGFTIYSVTEEDIFIKHACLETLLYVHEAVCMRQPYSSYSMPASSAFAGTFLSQSMCELSLILLGLATHQIIEAICCTAHDSAT